MQRFPAGLDLILFIPTRRRRSRRLEPGTWCADCPRAGTFAIVCFATYTVNNMNQRQYLSICFHSTVACLKARFLSVIEQGCRHTNNTILLARAYISAHCYRAFLVAWHNFWTKSHGPLTGAHEPILVSSDHMSEIRNFIYLYGNCRNR